MSTAATRTPGRPAFDLEEALSPCSALRADRGRRRPVHRPDAEPPPEWSPGRQPLQAPHACEHLAERCDALGHPPPRKAPRRSIRPGRRALHSAGLRHSCRVQRGAALASREDRRCYDAATPTHSAVSSPSCRRICWTCDATAVSPATRRWRAKTLFFKFNTGPSGHGSPAAAGEATALKLAGAEDVRGVRHGRRRRNDRGSDPRSQEHRLRSGAWQPGLPGGLERSRHRPALDFCGGVGHSRVLVRALRVERVGHSCWFGLHRDPSGARAAVRRGATEHAELSLGQDPQGPRLRRVRRGLARRGAQAQHRSLLAVPVRVCRALRRLVPGSGRITATGRPGVPRADLGQPAGRARRAEGEARGELRVPGRSSGRTRRECAGERGPTARARRRRPRA